MRIKTKVEIQLNTNGTWEVLRFLSGPTKQVKLGSGKLDNLVKGTRLYEKTKEEEEGKWEHEVWPDLYPKPKPTPVQDALDRMEKTRRAHKTGYTFKRRVQQCTACGMENKNRLTCLAHLNGGKRVHRKQIKNDRWGE